MTSFNAPLIDQHWLSALHASLVAKRHRGVIILEGDLAWAQANFQQQLALVMATDKEPVTYQVYSDDSEVNPTVSSKNYRHHLGSENTLIFFADMELNVDALAALSGTILAGGCLLIWRNSVDTQSDDLMESEGKLVGNNKHLSPFEKRFEQVLRESAGNNIFIFNQFDLEQDRFYSMPELAISSIKANKFNTPKSNDTLTSDQENTMMAIKKVVTGHRNRPLVITADRGRGKSSALAIACADLVKNSAQSLNIVITAPSVLSLTVFFRQLKGALPEAKWKNEGCEWQGHRIFFQPIDVLLREKPTVNLVMVDEAAGIPVYLLSSLLERYHRIVFSSTVHGYEGAGRGFTIKFLQRLKSKYPQFQQSYLSEPIRFANNDPLEKFIAKLCLLDAELTDLTASITTDLCNNYDELIEQSEFVTITKDTLLSDESLLASVFSVLVTAHYQTKPSDLKLLLDNPLVYVNAMMWNNQVLAVALIIEEGDVPLQDIQGIKKAQRRLKNQFLPQSLTVHCGINNAFDYKYLRIMRIAVHPQIQQKGLGHFFLHQLAHWAQNQHADFIGTSFAANYTLTKFWLNANYRIARLGFTPDAASGEHSIMMLNALSDYAQTLQKTCEYHFYRTFDYYLVDEYQQLAVDLVALILAHSPKQLLPEKTTHDIENVLGYVQGHQQYSNSVFSLHIWLRHYLSNRVIFTNDLHPLIARIMMKKSVENVCQYYGERYGLTGKKSLNNYIQHIIKQEVSL